MHLQQSAPRSRPGAGGGWGAAVEHRERAGKTRPSEKKTPPLQPSQRSGLERGCLRWVGAGRAFRGVAPATVSGRDSAQRWRDRCSRSGPLGALVAHLVYPRGPKMLSDGLGGRVVGYARVSTDDQVTRLQRDALKRAGASIIFEEKASAASRRPQLERALAYVTAGDVLVVWKLDRLARSLRDLLNMLERLHAARVGLRSLTEPIDTSTPAGVLMIQVLGAVAQFERSLIRERTIAGQVAAINRGARVGRPKKLTDAQEWEVCEALLEGATQRAVAERFGVSQDVVKMAWFRLVRPEHPRLAGNGRRVLAQYLRK